MDEDALSGLFAGCIFGLLITIVTLPFRLLALLGFKGILVILALCAIVVLLLKGIPIPNPPPITISNSTYIVGISNAKGRECPKLSCRTIVTFKSGEEIQVSGSVEGDTVEGNKIWLLVLYKNSTIYVHSSLASPKITPPALPTTISTVPVTTIPTVEVPKPNKDVALLSPFNNGVTWTLKNGYYENKAQDAVGCGVGTKGLDHCRNQLFGLDLLPDPKFSNDKMVLAPVSGKVSFVGGLPGGCIGLTLKDNLNLNVCHFASVNVKPGDQVDQGKVLGLRNTSHVHLSLDDRYNKGNLCKSSRCYLPIPFNGVHTLESLSLEPNHNGTGDLVDLSLVYPLCGEKVGIKNCQFTVQFQEYQTEISGQSHNIAIP